MMDTNTRQDIINYMIKKNPDATIKEYLVEIDEMEKDCSTDKITRNTGTVISTSEVQYRENRYNNGRKGVNKPVIRFSGIETAKGERPKGKYSNPQYNVE